MRKLLVLCLLFLIPRLLPAQASGAGNIGCPGATLTGTVANSGTSNNTVLATVTATPCPAILVQLDQTTTLSAGAITFNLSNDLGTNYTAVPVAQVLNQSSFVQLTNPYTVVASTNQAFIILLNGATYFQVKLTTAITGSGSVTPYVTPIGLPPGLSLDANGNVKVNLNANSFGTVTVSGTVTTTPPSNASTNEAQINGVTPLMGNGTSGTGSQRVNVASDNSPFETIPVATATTTDTSLRCTLVSAASTNSTNCKGSAGNVYGFRFVNTTTTIYYLRMYNSASAPTCSSATGFIESIPIPPAGASGQAGGIVSIEPFGEGYSTGIGFCFTGGSSSTDNTNAATGIFGTVLYK